MNETLRAFGEFNSNQYKNPRSIERDNLSDMYLYQLRRISKKMCQMSFVSIALVFIQLSISYENGHWKAAKEEKSSWITVILFLSRTFLSACCLFHGYLLCRFYRMKLKYMISRHVIAPGVSVFNSHLFSSMILELIVCMIHPFPGIDHLGSIHTPVPIFTISMIVLGRIYFIPRYMYYKYPVHSQNGELLSPLSYLEHNGIVMIKTALEDYPLHFSFFSLSTLVVLSSYFLGMMETVLCDHYHYEHCSHLPWSDSIWIILVSLTTIGYGDIYVYSLGGRLIVITAGAIGYIVNAIIFSLTLKFFELSISESRVIVFLTRAQHNLKKKFLSASLIELSWKQYQQYKHSTKWRLVSYPHMHIRVSSNSKQTVHRIKKKIAQLRLLRNEYNQLILNIDAPSKLKKNREAMSVSVQELRDKITKLALSISNRSKSNLETSPQLSSSAKSNLVEKTQIMLKRMKENQVNLQGILPPMNLFYKRSPSC